MFEDLEAELHYLTEYLESQDDPGIRIAPIFVAYALTLIHAKFEIAIRAAICERCRGNDVEVNSYIASTVHKSVRSIRVGELKGVLGQFDDQSKEAFVRQSEEFEMAFQFYSNLETNRQGIAHGGAISATMNDVSTWFLEARTVIAEFREALGLPQ